MPCSAAQSSAGQSRSAKTRTIRAPSARAVAGVQSARRLEPVPETPTAIRPLTPLPHAVVPLLDVPRAAPTAATAHDRRRLSHAPTPSRCSAAGATAAAVRRHDDDHAEAAVERRPELGVRRARRARPIRRMTEGIGQRPRIEHARRGRRAATRGTLPGQAAAGDVGDPAESVPAARRSARTPRIASA